MQPHAPQFFTMPETEDRAAVARVKEGTHEIGSRIKALKPNLWIIFADDHAAPVALDHQAIVTMGTHPLLPFLARLQVDRSGR